MKNNTNIAIQILLLKQLIKICMKINIHISFIKLRYGNDDKRLWIKFSPT